ncbi:MAG: TrkA family potassium uptake protein [Thermoleophilia bacterium]|nr:TrkA family potassium uptake protein [Thermoleophilia bacterium]
MYAVIVGGGVVGYNVLRALTSLGYETVLIEKEKLRFANLEAEYEHMVLHGDGTELAILEAAGVGRADLVIAVTGLDDDNIVIAQLSKEHFKTSKCIARVNDPRNQEHFDALGVRFTVSASQSILSLIEHEVPDHRVVNMLNLRHENLEIIELNVTPSAPIVGQPVAKIRMPSNARLISVTRDNQSSIAVGDTVVQPGDRVMAILEPSKEEELIRLLLGD